MTIGDRKGQTLFEFSIFCGILSALVIFMGKSLILRWDQSRCAYQVFEATRLALSSEPQRSSTRKVRVYETEKSFVGEARCRQAFERVELFKLEFSTWKN